MTAHFLAKIIRGPSSLRDGDVHLISLSTLLDNRVFEIVKFQALVHLKNTIFVYTVKLGTVNSRFKKDIQMQFHQHKAFFGDSTLLSKLNITDDVRES